MVHATSEWKCAKCGYKFLVQKDDEGNPVHRCPKCFPEDLERYHQMRALPKVLGAKNHDRKEGGMGMIVVPEDKEMTIELKWATVQAIADYYEFPVAVFLLPEDEWKEKGDTTRLKELVRASDALELIGEILYDYRKGGGQEVNAYGKELILDIHECDASLFNRQHIKRYFKRLCEIIDMERCELYWWDDKDVSIEDQQTDPRLKGTSAIQFILTSNITIHTLDLMGHVHLNIFSCKDFDADSATGFSKEWFKGKVVNAQVIRRL